MLLALSSESSSHVWQFHTYYTPFPKRSGSKILTFSMFSYTPSHKKPTRQLKTLHTRNSRLTPKQKQRKLYWGIFEEFPIFSQWSRSGPTKRNCKPYWYPADVVLYTAAAHTDRKGLHPDGMWPSCWSYQDTRGNQQNDNAKYEGVEIANYMVSCMSYYVNSYHAKFHIPWDIQNWKLHSSKRKFPYSSE